MIEVKVSVSTCDDGIKLTNIRLILSQKELYTEYDERTEQTRNLEIMENNEEQDLSIEQNEPHRGRNGNNGRNQAPRPFIQPDDPLCC